MLELHHKVNPKESVVGWYATGSDINETTVFIHDFFAKETSNQGVGVTSYPPIHLTLDTNLTNYTMSIKAYISSSITIGEKSFGTQFLPTPVEVQTSETERIAIDSLRKAKLGSGITPLVSDLQGLEASIRKVLELLDNIAEYVNNVLADKTNGDNNIGRFLVDAISALPRLESSTLEKMFNNGLQDLLLVVYLANLTRTQLQLAEKLQKVVEV